jgi:hypothetical protein
MGFSEGDYWTTGCDMFCEAEGQQWALSTWQTKDVIRLTQSSQYSTEVKVAYQRVAPFSYAQSLLYSIAQDTGTTNCNAVFHEIIWSCLNLCLLHLRPITTHENCAILDYYSADSEQNIFLILSSDVHISQNIYRVIHKSLRDFRTRLRNNQDRQAERSISIGRESLQVLFVLGALY